MPATRADPTTAMQPSLAVPTPLPLPVQRAAEGSSAVAFRRALALIDGPGSAEERLQRVRAELISAAGPRAAPDFSVSERQMATLRLLALGLDNRTIAARLGVGEATVKTHLKRLLDRLNLRNRTALVLWAIRQGLVSP